MHRSGTSLTAQLAEKAGCRLPDDLMPGHSLDNPAGYFESRAVATINNQFLAAIGSHWKDPGALPPDAFGGEAAESARNAIDEFLKRYPEVDLLLKDPRISRLCPLWIPVLKRHFPRICTILVVRHPDQVYRSLKRRAEHAPIAAAAITSVVHSDLLWWRYTLEALYHTQDLPPLILGFEDLISSPERILSLIRKQIDPTAADQEDCTTVDIREPMSTSGPTPERSLPWYRFVIGSHRIFLEGGDREFISHAYQWSRLRVPLGDWPGDTPGGDPGIFVDGLAKELSGSIHIPAFSCIGGPGEYPFSVSSRQMSGSGRADSLDSGLSLNDGQGHVPACTVEPANNPPDPSNPVGKSLNDQDAGQRRDQDHGLLHRFPFVHSQGTSIDYCFVSPDPSTRGHIYRVKNPTDALLRDGYSACWLRPGRSSGIGTVIDRARCVIFHRCPDSPELRWMVDKARRSGGILCYDIDDYIFSPAALSDGTIPFALDFPPEKQREWLDRIRLYESAMATADIIVTPTNTLSRLAVDHFSRPAVTIPNCFSPENLALSSYWRNSNRRDPGIIRIGYASGTGTHDRDFSIVAGVLDHLLETDPRVRVRIIGPLDSGLNSRSAERVERRPLVRHIDLAQELSAFDINIIPLIDSPFCGAKSPLKYFEASLVGVPTIASHNSTYAELIEPGSDGMLADSESAWDACLARLLDDPALRNSLAEKAFEKSMRTFSIDRNIQRYVSLLSEQAGIT